MGAAVEDFNLGGHGFSRSHICCCFVVAAAAVVFFCFFFVSGVVGGGENGAVGWQLLSRAASAKPSLPGKRKPTASSLYSWYGLLMLRLTLVSVTVAGGGERGGGWHEQCFLRWCWYYL